MSFRVVQVTAGSDLEERIAEAVAAGIISLPIEGSAGLRWRAEVALQSFERGLLEHYRGLDRRTLNR
jgi:hypothetical protein